jgi:type I restriction enzyme S subunit
MSNSSFQNIILKDLLLPNGYIRGPFGSALKRDDMLSEGIPVYEQQHAINNHRNFRYFISTKKYEEMKRFQVMPNDLIISCSGTIGRVSLISNTDPIGIINQALLILRCDTQKVLPHYLKYYFTSNKGHQSLIERSKGSVQVNIAKRSVIENISLELPDIPTQAAIVNILKAFDKKIEKNNEETSLLYTLILSAYHDWFFKFNYRDLSSEVITTIPKGWVISSAFENIVEVREKNTENRDYPVLSVVKEGEFRLSEDVFTKQVYSKNTTNYKVVRRNQVAYNPARANIGSIAMLTDFDVGLVSPIYVVFKMKETITPTFFYYYMKQPMFLKNIKHHAIGTTRQNFPFEAFKMFNMVVPPMELQLRFEEIAKPIEQKIAKLKEENAVLAEIRDTLLPKLISGELPVEVGEA